jgi:hypothetical protein
LYTETIKNHKGLIMNITNSLDALAQKDLTDIRSDLLSSPSYKEVSKFIKDEDQALLLSSVMTGLLTIAWLDHELTKLEVKYLLREIKSWHPIESEAKIQLLDSISHLVKDDSQLQELIPSHFSFLAKTLDSKQKLKFFEDLIIISRADLDIDRKEVNLIKALGSSLKIDKTKQDDLLVNAKFIVIQRLSEAAGDEEMEILETPYSLSKKRN